MGEFITAITTGVLAFTATNIDDIFILLLFFSQVNANLTHKHIVIGQYLGFIVLVIASLSGLFGGLILPTQWVGLLGLLPVVMGISSLVNGQEESLEEIQLETKLSEETVFTSFVSPQTYSVAAVTVANGSDNISVYVPLFASSDLGTFLVTVFVFFSLIGIWCFAAYQLTHQKEIAELLTRYGKNFVPFVLIGLGSFILLKNGTLSLTKLIASCFCLTILVKKNNS
ncbi:cadmium resistance transporter [Scytonema sp. NUACC21]